MKLLSESAAWREIARRCEEEECAGSEWSAGMCNHAANLADEGRISWARYDVMIDRTNDTFAQAERNLWFWKSYEQGARIIAAGLLAAMTERPKK